jgi:peptidoglycan-associated lipoprotein
MQMIRPIAFLGLVAITVTFGACHKKQPAEQPTPQPRAEAAPAARDTAAENASERERLAAEAARRVTESARATLTEMVFFDYDKSELRPDAQDVVNRKVSILLANLSVALRIEGHADERGGVEYNLALSLRRANTVRDYMANFGVDVGRLEVTGFGEERPLDTGSNETAWARNRRAEFQIVRGGEQLTLPR